MSLFNADVLAAAVLQDPAVFFYDMKPGRIRSVLKIMQAANPDYLAHPEVVLAAFGGRAPFPEPLLFPQETLLITLQQHTEQVLFAMSSDQVYEVLHGLAETYPDEINNLEVAVLAIKKNPPLRVDLQGGYYGICQGLHRCRITASPSGLF